MMNVISSLLTIETMITVLIGFAAFGTVLTLVSPFFETDNLKDRMKGVAAERDRLRAQQKLALTQGESKLRDKSKAGVVSQLVESLNLRKLFEAESSRELLRQAGMRSEKNLVTFLALRLLAPLVLGIGVFIYTSTAMSDSVKPTMKMLYTFGGLVLGFYLPTLFLKNLITRRQESIRNAWSDALDLLLICVESGMSIELAMQRVAREIGSQSVPLAEELTLTVAELSYLQDRRKAYDNLGRRTGLLTVRAVVTSLIQSERYGTPLGTALRVLAQENRDQRMSEAEKKAAALPPKLTVPMILFFLPVIFVVILGPSIILVMKMQ
jgi:tight adherence protein C